MAPESRLRSLLTFLYGPEQAANIWPALEDKLAAFRRKRPERPSDAPPRLPLTEKDAILITYGDQFRAPGQTPLQTLHTFLETYLEEAVSGVHLLPFFPYTSDDGFSVVDYRQVDSAVGGWDDIARLGEKYRLMFDAVINHISRESKWFRGYLRGDARYRNYFIEADPAADLSAVVRPRALPLLTPVRTAGGMRHVWTTFSDDQIDLNYANPEVLLEITDVLLFYVSKGAEIIRLDAIAYLWKQPGTSSIHLPQTHAIVKFWRAVLDAVAPQVLLITETNVPHQENISYFGDGGDEAQIVYQFPLAPLVLHTFLTGDARTLTAWATGLETPSARTSFFNFIASHDGIGMRPAEGILTPEEIAALVARTQTHGGQVSYRHHPDGTQSVYELNITLYDFLNDPAAPEPDLDARRFLASQAIMLSLAGVPGVYVHSLLGSRNCHPCVAETGRARSINREKFDFETFRAMLDAPDSRPARILAGYRRLLRQRGELPAFHPASPQQVFDLHPGVFALRRGDQQPVLCLVNVTGHPVALEIPLAALELATYPRWQDRLEGDEWTAADGHLSLALAPYRAAWLAPA